MSAVIGRWPCTTSLIRLGDTSMLADSLRADAHGLHKVFQQNFAGVNFVKQFRHVSLLVVIHNFNPMCVVFTRNKAQPPLVLAGAHGAPQKQNISR